MATINRPRFLTHLFLLIVLLVASSSFVFAEDKVEQVLFYNKQYSSWDIENPLTGQLITFENNITINAFSVMMKTTDFSTSPVFMYVYNNATNEIIATAYSTATYTFKPVIFPFNNLNLTNGSYKFEIDSNAPYKIVANLVNTDYFTNGYMIINSVKVCDECDLYFYLRGKTTSSPTQLEEVTNIDLLTGGDKKFKAIMGLLVLIGLFGSIGYKIKKDFLLLIASIGCVILLSLMGLITFWLATGLIIFDVIFYGVFKKNE